MWLARGRRPGDLAALRGDDDARGARAVARVEPVERVGRVGVVAEDVLAPTRTTPRARGARRHRCRAGRSPPRDRAPADPRHRRTPMRREHSPARAPSGRQRPPRSTQQPRREATASSTASRPAAGPPRGRTAWAGRARRCGAGTSSASAYPAANAVVGRSRATSAPAARAQNAVVHRRDRRDPRRELRQRRPHRRLDVARRLLRTQDQRVPRGRDVTVRVARGERRQGGGRRRRHHHLRSAASGCRRADGLWGTARSRRHAARPVVRNLTCADCSDTDSSNSKRVSL